MMILYILKLKLYKHFQVYYNSNSVIQNTRVITQDCLQLIWIEIIKSKQISNFIFVTYQIYVFSDKRHLGVRWNRVVCANASLEITPYAILQVKNILKSFVTIYFYITKIFFNKDMKKKFRFTSFWTMHCFLYLCHENWPTSLCLVFIVFPFI